MYMAQIKLRHKNKDLLILDMRSGDPMKYLLSTCPFVSLCFCILLHVIFLIFCMKLKQQKVLKLKQIVLILLKININMITIDIIRTDSIIQPELSPSHILIFEKIV